MNTEKSSPSTNYGVIPSLLTVEELAEQLRIGRSSAYALVKNRQIRSIRIGRSIRIPRNAVAEFIEEAQAS